MDETSTEAFTYPTETFSSEYGFSDHSTQDSFLAHVPLSTDTPTPAQKESDDSEKQPASTSLSDVAMPPPEFADKKTIGQYYLMEQIGEGGMGLVYRARHKVSVAQMTGDVAIKVLHAKFTQDSEFLHYDLWQRPILGERSSTQISFVYTTF